MSEYTAIEHTTGSRRRGLDYSNLDTNTSGRPGLTKVITTSLDQTKLYLEKLRTSLRRLRIFIKESDW